MEICQLIGTLLYYYDGYIEFGTLEKAKQYMLEENRYKLDISEASLYSMAYFWNSYFEMTEKGIKLTDYYKKNSYKVRKRFFDCLDIEKKEYLFNLIGYI